MATTIWNIYWIPHMPGAVWNVLHTCSQSSCWPRRKATTSAPSSPLKKPKLGELMQLIQGHTTSKDRAGPPSWQGLPPGLVLFPIVPSCPSKQKCTAVRPLPQKGQGCWPQTCPYFSHHCSSRSLVRWDSLSSSSNLTMTLPSSEKR